MEEREKKEEKNKRIGWLTSVSIQLLLLVLFYFIIAWREPFPPIPEYGIELGFTTSAGASASTSSQPSETEEVVEESTVQESAQEPVKVTESVEDVSESEPEPEVVTQVVEDVPVIPETATQEESVNESEPATDEEELEPIEEEMPVVNERALMKASEAGTEENEGSREGKEENQEIDSRAIYGNSGEKTGSNEGASLAMAGWIWDFKPEPKDDSDQSGKIVYKIVVDQEGYLVKIETVTSTVSPEVERKYREAVQRLTFSKTGDYQAAASSTGTVTFIIKSR